MIEQEQLWALPRTELCEANVGQDRHWVMLGNGRTGKVCVGLRGKWWLQNWSWRRRSQLIKKERDPPLPRIVIERAPEVEPRCFYALSADIGGAALASHGKATKPHNDECRERIRTIIERTLTGKARVNAYKDRIAETERVRERTRARIEEGAEDVLMEPGNRDDEQVAVRRADASGGDIMENQHEENRMRDIQVNKWGSEGKWRTIRQIEEESTIRAKSSECISVFRSICCSGVSCEWWDTQSAGVRTCAEVRSCWWRRTKFCVGSILREEWTKESFHRRSVGAVSRRRWRRSQEKWIEWRNFDVETTLCEFRSTYQEIDDVNSWRSSCDDAMPHETALCWSLLAAWTSRRTASWGELTMRKFTKTSTTNFVKWLVWMEHSEDAIRIEWIRAENNRFLHKQLENQNSLGELLWRACAGSLGEKLDDSWDADYVVEHVPSQTDRNNSEGTS